MLTWILKKQGVRRWTGSTWAFVKAVINNYWVPYNILSWPAEQL
jgi:hypothetical protein